jgi:hypothetical protein
MDSTLNDIFTTYNTMLDDILKLGVGGEGDYSTLPGQVSKTHDRCIMPANTLLPG